MVFVSKMLLVKVSCNMGAKNTITSASSSSSGAPRRSTSFLNSKYLFQLVQTQCNIRLVATAVLCHWLLLLGRSWCACSREVCPGCDWGGVDYIATVCCFWLAVDWGLSQRTCTLRLIPTVPYICLVIGVHNNMKQEFHSIQLYVHAVWV